MNKDILKGILIAVLVISFLQILFIREETPTPNGKVICNGQIIKICSTNDIDYFEANIR